ncbi:HAMP domain-containing sensor histidine kinase [Thioclava sp. GXIMD2076]|uniref:histidine kinase n=1 Tax=Thioclava kandeliae TaxID=3070818 RepID=A0ABV1SDN0_9RHOB
MRLPRSLGLRIALLIGAGVAVLWLAAAVVTAGLMSREMNRVFDRELSDTAQRILPFALREQRLRARNSGEVQQGTRDHSTRENQSPNARSRPDPQRNDRSPNDRLWPPPPPENRAVARLDDRPDTVEFIVRNQAGDVLLQTDGSEDIAISDDITPGFLTLSGYRTFTDYSPRAGLSITVAEPLDHRQAVRRNMILLLSLPLLIALPLGLGGIFWAVRRALNPVRQLEHDLALRGPQRLDPLESEHMVSELRPIADGINAVLSRLKAAFDSERSFASNAAHEMRTPVAGAIAQAQRLRAESSDPVAISRALEIEGGLKRLSRLSEKLMQMARAEGAQLRLDGKNDLRMILDILLDDMRRADPAIAAGLDVNRPDRPVMSDLDPDAFAILARNLIENARKHGTGGVEISLSPDGRLTVRNDAPALPPEQLARISDRFARGDGAGDGTGLGLAIAHVIAERSGATLELHSPIPGKASGFQAVFLP